MSESSLPLRHYLAVLRRQWWVIVAVAGAAVVVAGFITAVGSTPVHRASMKMVVGQGGGVFQPQYGANVQPFTQTMTNLLESDIVASTVIDNLKLDTTPRELLSHLSVTSRSESAVLQLSYDSTRSREAVRILSEIGSVFATLVDQRLGSRAETTPNTEPLPQITATVFDPAHLQPGTIGTSSTKTIGVAGILGLVLGIALAFLRDALDDRIRSSRDAERSFGAPVIGAIPRGLSDRRSSRRLKPEVVEALQLLRANLQFSQPASTGPLLVVTSALRREGKTAVAANIAMTLATSGSDVVCVEADLRRPALFSYLGVETNGPGLVDIILDEAEIDEALVQVPIVNKAGRVGSANGASGQGRAIPAELKDAFGANGRGQSGQLAVIPAGRMAHGPEDLLTSERARQFVASLRSRADFVIFDSAPVLNVGDAFPLLRLADHVLVVARQGRSKEGTAEAVQETLGRLGVDHISVVLLGSSNLPSSERPHGDLFSNGIFGGLRRRRRPVEIDPETPAPKPRPVQAPRRR